jgi:hypothetical protein
VQLTRLKRATGIGVTQLTRALAHNV